MKSHEKIPISGIKLKASIKRHIQRLWTPYYKGTPDRIDKRIYAEAVFLKRNFFSDEQIYLASLDTYFSPVRKDSIIRDKINEKFKIFCDWPSNICSELKKDYASNKKK